MRFADLDAVTIDGYGTLLTLRDPIPRLQGALQRHGVARTAEEVETAFRAEVVHYRPRSHLGCDGASLAALRGECVAVFLEAAGVDLAPQRFVDDFVGALEFEAVSGAAEAVAVLRERGLRLGVVANWDISLREQLERTGLRGFDAVVTSAEAGVPKPDPRIFRLTLDRLGVAPERALHVGDEDCDRDGAAAAGLHFAPAPLARAFAGWT